MRWRGFLSIACLFLVATVFCTVTSLRNRDRTVPIPPSRNTDLFRVITLTGNGFINANGDLIISPRPWVLGDFSEGMALAQVGEKYGYIDLRGKLAIPAVYKIGIPFQYGRAIVWDQADILVINRSNTVMRKLTGVFDDIREFSEGLAPAAKSGRWGFVDTNFVFKIPPQYSEVFDFHDGYAPVKVENVWGAISRTGDITVHPRFDRMFRFSEGLAAVRLNGSIGYLGTNDTFVIQPRFEDGGEFHDGLSPARERGHWGYIDRNGLFRIKPRFSLAYEFSYGRAAVEFHGKFGFIDQTGEFVIERKFATANPFERGLAWVETRGMFVPHGAYIRTNGVQVWPK